MGERAKSIVYKCACAIVCLGVFAFLATRVSKKAHPWEMVLQIDNGLDQDSYSASSMGNRVVTCFSPDDKTLFVATSRGLIEVWDMGSMKRKNVFGMKREPEPNEEHAHLKGAWNLEVNDLGQLVESRWEKLFFHSQEGDLIREYELDSYRRFSVSTDGELLAGGFLRPNVIILKTGEQKQLLLSSTGFNGGNSGFQWSKDKKKLLINDAVVFALVNTDTWGTEILARTDHLDLVNEAEQESEVSVDENRKWTAMLMDSQFVDADRKIASIYNADGWKMTAIDPRENVIRFTDVESGKLLKSLQLPEAPRSMWVSDEGDKIYVTMCPGFSTLLNIYDAKSMSKLASVESKVTNRFPTRVMALGGEGNHIIQYSGGAVMQDWDESYSPVRFEPLDNRVIQILQNKKSDMLVTVLNSREIHVWKKRREASKWGAFVLWEYGASYLCLIALLLLPVYWLKRGTMAQKKRPFRKLEWVILCISAITIATAISSVIYKPLLADIWLYYNEGVSLWSILGLSIPIGCYIGLLLQSDGWRKFNRFLSLVAGVIIVGFLIYFIVQLSSMSFDVYHEIIPSNRFDGFTWNLSLLSVIGLAVLSCCLLCFKFWVLRVPFKTEEE